jgi:hypothetical protein
MAMTNWIAPTALPASVNYAITRMLLQTNWAGTAESKFGWVNVVVYLTDISVTVGPYGSAILAEVYSDAGPPDYKLWYKFVPALIPS